jgi:hypothetical protein
MNGEKRGQCPRGHTVCFYHTILLEDGEKSAKLLKDGKFFPINKLPQPMIHVHEEMIGWLSKNFH